MEHETSKPVQSHLFVLIWLCPSDALPTLPLVRFRNNDNIKFVEIFDETLPCFSRLSNLKNEKVILILSNTWAKDIAIIAHHEPNILYIYLFSNDTEADFQWIHDYSKAHGPYFDIDALTSEVLSNIAKWVVKVDKITSCDDESVSIDIYKNTNHLSSSTNVDKTIDDFILFQVFIDVFFSSSELTNEHFSKIAARMCRERYKDDPNILKTIDSFEYTYTPQDAIRWYTKTGFLSRTLSKAFYHFDFALLFAFRFFIVDLHNQLNVLQSVQKQILTDCIKLYAGKSLPTNEVERLKNNVGGLISIKTFFETTLDFEVALVFSGHGVNRPQFESVLYKIQINSNVNCVKPYAYIANLSDYSDEQAVLFSVGFVFKIESVELDEAAKIWYVNLVCNSDVQNEVKELIDQLKMDLGTPVNYITFGNVLNKFNKLDETWEYYQMLLKTLSLSKEDSAKIFFNIGTAYQLQNHYNSALEYYQKALRIYDSTSNYIEKTPNDVDESQYKFEELSQIYNHIGSVYLSMNDYRTALMYFQKSLAVVSDTHNQSLNLGTAYYNIGNVYFNMGNDDKALEFFEKALSIASKTQSSEHPFLGQCLRNIGVLTKQSSILDDIASATKNLQCLSKLNDKDELSPS